MLFRHQDGKPFTASDDPREILIYTDGACSDNGQSGARGGCTFVYLCSDGVPNPWNPPPGAYIMNGAYFFRLEDVGPDGHRYEATSNRAELRAVIAALQFLQVEKINEKFGDPVWLSSLVIATDSTYVVEGATKWCNSWESNGWIKSNGKPAINQDLWKLLLKRCRVLQRERCRQISFWHIPRDENETADSVAKYAATRPARSKFGTPDTGIMPIFVDPSQI